MGMGAILHLDSRAQRFGEVDLIDVELLVWCGSVSGRGASPSLALRPQDRMCCQLLQEYLYFTFCLDSANFSMLILSTC